MPSSYAITPSSYGSLPTPCPTGWASTICFDCRVGCALLPTKWSPTDPSHPLSLKQTRDEGKFGDRVALSVALHTPVGYGDFRLNLQVRMPLTCANTCRADSRADRI